MITMTERVIAALCVSAVTALLHLLLTGFPIWYVTLLSIGSGLVVMLPWETPEQSFNWLISHPGDEDEMAGG